MRADRHSYHKHLPAWVVVILLAGCAGAPQAHITFISQVAEEKYGFHWVGRNGGDSTVVFLPSNNISYIKWSPDGRHIIARKKDTGEYYLLALGSDAEGRCLTCGVDDYALPVFSPQGDKIAFSARSGLYVIDVNGSDQRQLAGIPKPFDISWSPDGSVVAFVGGGDPSKWNIYRVDEDGSNLINLTGDAAGGQCWGIQCRPPESKSPFLIKRTVCT